MLRRKIIILILYLKVFIKTIKSRSIYDFNIEVSNTDKILTLSTCTKGGKNRVVLHAVMDK